MIYEVTRSSRVYYSSERYSVDINSQEELLFSSCYTQLLVV